MSVTIIGPLVWKGSAQEPSEKGVNFCSLAQEAQLGREVTAELQHMLPVVYEPQLDTYIARLSRAASRHSGDPCHGRRRLRSRSNDPVSGGAIVGWPNGTVLLNASPKPSKS